MRGYPLDERVGDKSICRIKEKSVARQVRVMQQVALSERILVFPPKLSSKPKAQLNIFASVTSTSSFTAGLSLAIAQKCLQLHEILASSLTQLIFKSTDKSNHFDLSPNSESIFGSHIMILIILIADSSWHKDLSYSL